VSRVTCPILWPCHLLSTWSHIWWGELHSPRQGLEPLVTASMFIEVGLQQTLDFTYLWFSTCVQFCQPLYLVYVSANFISVHAQKVNAAGIWWAQLLLSSLSCCHHAFKLVIYALKVNHLTDEIIVMLSMLPNHVINLCVIWVSEVVAARSKAWIFFARSNTGIVGSNLTWDMYFCVRLFCVCAVLRAGNGLATGWSPVQGVLPTV
jgi:hypothetical protein